jgi:nitrate reductase delta subunit
VLKQVGLTQAEVEEMYHVMAIANYEDRFVIPTAHREYAENAFDMRGGCGFSFGNGCSDGASRDQPVRQQEAAHHPDQGGGLSHGTPCSRSPTPAPDAARAGPLLSYPDAELRAHVPELREALHAEGRCRCPPHGRAGRADARWSAALDPLERGGVRRAFDRGRATSLHLFEHVHGDSRDRGPAMIDLADLREGRPASWPRASCPTTCRWCWSSPRPSRRSGQGAFLGEMAHILNAIFSALQQRNSPYASVLAALLELAGARAGGQASPRAAGRGLGRARSL